MPALVSPRVRRLPAALVVVCVVSVLGLVAWSARDDSTPAEAAAPEPADSEEREVTLSPARLEAAGLRVKPCQPRPLADVRTVPGRLTYDEARHVSVRVPVDGVVREVRVKPGDVVAAGDVIALVSSPAVGAARADALQREADNRLAARKSEWEEQVTANVEELVRSLEEQPELATVERAFEKKLLGNDRELVLGAYSKFVLARALDLQLQPLADQGIAAGRVVRERASNRQVAEAAYRAACEQAVFDARQKREQSKSAAEDAERRLRIARNHLATLVGREETEIADDAETLSMLEVRSPIGGTVEDRLVASAERVAAGDALFVVADIERLWVAADIRENDWDITTLEPGAEVTVHVPGLENRAFPARVHYVGRTVNGLSHALPLVAVIDNGDRLLRPGMFVRVSIAVGGDPPAVLAVPTAAVMEHEEKRFVFVEERPGAYRRADVTIGRQTDEWTEIRRGLEPGDAVVAAGAFVLKSELLLEAEE